jgi:hypothetical protein
MTAPAMDITGQGTQPSPGVPWVSWPVLSAQVNRMWDPENTPHHSVVALSGGGKSFLIVNGLLKPMCAWDRVLIVDTKGDDPTLSHIGFPVKEIPRPKWKSRDQRKKGDQWFRLIVNDDPKEGRGQVARALDRVYAEGEWVVVFDEIRDITDPDSNRFRGLDLLGPVDKMYRKGRYRHVSIIAATQSPRYAPSAFYDQASFAWIGRIRDEQRQRRLLEIGGMSRQELPLIAALKRRQWLLSADSGEYFARSQVEV